MIISLHIRKQVLVKLKSTWKSAEVTAMGISHTISLWFSRTERGRITTIKEIVMIKMPEMNMVIKQVVNFSALSLGSTSEDQNLINALSKESEIKILAKTEILMMMSNVPYSCSENKRVKIGSKIRPEHLETAANIP